tara:strand:- start:14283 stop:15014 length:732 start_codon:yes stop_codon:yes gene_type:complete
MALDYLIVIPARFSSSRFPGKPLVDIEGKSMIRRVWEKCEEIASDTNIIIATDDKRIEDHCSDNKMRVVRTSSECLTGTDRVAEVSKIYPANFYVNVQGDEPLIEPNDIKLVIDAFLKNPSCCFCGMTEIVREQDFYNSNIPKVVTDESNKLLYISRAPIPTTKDSKFLAAKRQVCIYGFTEESLNEYGPNSKKTHNENIEDIEILRLLEKGYEIRMVDVSGSSIAVDTPEDLERVRNHINGL